MTIKIISEDLRNKANELFSDKDYFYILDENKNPKRCELIEWTEWMEASNKDNNRRINEDEIDGKRISTIFLGMNQNLYRGGTPILFETMVFDENGNDIYMNRYSLWDESLNGHEKAKEWVKNGCK